MHKKVVVFGGGTGLSALLNGLKEFPVDITAIITVSDNGMSTGKLREEFDIPAVGDIRKVITNLSDTSPEIKKMLEYRFNTTSDLNGHPVGNLILTAMYNITGNLTKSIEYLEAMLDVRHKVLPISEDKDLTLVAKMKDGTLITGESEITHYKGIIDTLYYKNEPNVTEAVIKSIKKADLIIFSMGSLYTSLLPNIICKDVIKTLNSINTKIMYICNAMTEDGETNKFTVGDHIETINKYLDNRKVDIVLANNSEITEKTKNNYLKENKEVVKIDYEKIKYLDCNLIEKDLLKEENNILRHDAMKLSSTIVSYLMDN
jgi:uncharacterized cofD-like protein